MIKLLVRLPSVPADEPDDALLGPENMVDAGPAAQPRVRIEGSAYLATTLPGIERLTLIIAAVIGSRTDPRTVAAWSRGVARSPGTIRGWCRAAGVRPKAALELARLLRALALARSYGLRLEDTLDVVDARTLASLLRRGGLLSGLEPPELTDFLRQQRLITHAPLVSALRAAAIAGGFIHPHGGQRGTWPSPKITVKFTADSVRTRSTTPGKLRRA